MEITSRFRVANDQGLEDLYTMVPQGITQMYSGIVTEEKIEEFLFKYLNTKKIVSDLNSVAIQFIVAYKADEPVGFAILRKNGNRYEGIPEGKVIEIEYFFVLPQHSDEEVRDSLWKKCMGIVQSYDCAWMTVLNTDPFKEFYNTKGFEISGSVLKAPFNCPSTLLFKVN